MPSALNLLKSIAALAEICGGEVLAVANADDGHGFAVFVDNCEVALVESREVGVRVSGESEVDIRAEVLARFAEYRGVSC